MFNGKRMKLVDDALEIPMPDGSPPKQLLDIKDESSSEEFSPTTNMLEVDVISLHTQQPDTQKCHNNLSFNEKQKQKNVCLQQTNTSIAINTIPDISERLHLSMLKTSSEDGTTTTATTALGMHKKYVRLAHNNANNVNNVNKRSISNNNNNNNSNSKAAEEKTREDRRRAAHNEVERRRRDKINNYIAILKKMLPAELIRNIPTTSNCEDNGTGRTSCIDSKAQILIRVCEYIKTMESELIKLRECLKENAELRSRNQRLEIELQKVKDEGKAGEFISEGSSTAGFLDHTLNLLHNADTFADECVLDECELITCPHVE